MNAIKSAIGIAAGVVLGLMATIGLVSIVMLAIDTALEVRLQQLLLNSVAPAVGAPL